MRARIGTIASSQASGVPIDPHAEAYLNVAGISEPAHRDAFHVFVAYIKEKGIWQLRDAIWPMKGGNSASHSLNLKDPRDSDDAFRLQFFGGWVHNEYGAKGNSWNTYARTFYVPATHGDRDSAGLDFYSRTNIPYGYEIEMGCWNGSSGHWLMHSYGGSMSVSINSSYSNISAQSNTLGLLLGQRINSSTLEYYLKGELIDTVSISATSAPNMEVYLGCRNDGGAVLPMSKECAFASVGRALSPTQVGEWEYAIQNLQTAFNIEVE